MNNIAFSWSFESRFERSKQWYIIAATLIISGTLVSFLVGEYLLGIALIIFAGVYLLYDVNTHPLVHVTIDDAGIAINGDIYAYGRIESFCIIRADNTPLILRLNLMSRSMDHIDLFLDPAISLDDLTRSLEQYLTLGEEKQMTMIERLLLGLRL